MAGEPARERDNLRNLLRRCYGLEKNDCEYL
jgi:hypothetical protein